ncbi:MAG: S-layer-like array-like protein, partial [bacterium]
MTTRHVVRASALIAALFGINLDLGSALASPPPPPPRSDRTIGAPVTPKRIIEVPAPARHDWPLEVEIELLGGDGRLVYPGQGVGFSFRLNRDAYLVIYDIDTEGRTHLVYPRSRWDSQFVRGGVLHHLPGRNAGYRLVADGPPGEEFVVAVASDEP